MKYLLNRQENRKTGTLQRKLARGLEAFLMLLLLVTGGLLAPTPRWLSFSECAEAIHAKPDTKFQPWVLLG